jgi:hypothetical protein
MRAKKTYPYPSHRNPVRLTPSPPKPNYGLRPLVELQQRIMAGENIFPKRKSNKIPTCPIWFDGILSGVLYRSWCFECFVWIEEAQGHGIIKNRNDARFWGLKEKKALCGNCLEKRLLDMPPRKRYLFAEYQKRYTQTF